MQFGFFRSKLYKISDGCIKHKTFSLVKTIPLDSLLTSEMAMEVVNPFAPTLLGLSSAAAKMALLSSLTNDHAETLTSVWKIPTSALEENAPMFQVAV